VSGCASETAELIQETLGRLGESIPAKVQAIEPLRPSGLPDQVPGQMDPAHATGNSGITTEPHLHYHLQNGPQPFLADGLPIQFSARARPAFARAQLYPRAPMLGWIEQQWAPP
jgi:hypothetical protein